MKVKFEFNLPDDLDDYTIYSNAQRMHHAICELKNEMRAIYKYEESHSDEVYDIIERLQNKLNESLETIVEDLEL